MSLKQGDHSTVFWGEGENYKGEWLHDRKHGYGVQTYKSGDSKYEGQFVHNKRQGEGVLWLAENKSKTKMRKEYIGKWKNDQRHGTGTAFYPHGECYTGDWQNGKRHGEGQMKYKDGGIYVGQWYDDVRTGYGHLTKANGDVYEGYWVANGREGGGSYFYKSTGKVFVGEWAADQPIAGLFQQAIKNPAESGQLPVTTVVPPLQLEDGEDVLNAALANVRSSRLLFRAVHTPLEKLYTAEDLANLKNVYEKGDIANLHTVLTSELEIRVGKTKLDGLVGDFFAYKAAGGISPSGIGLAAGAPEEAIAIDFEAFAKIVAILLDEELVKVKVNE
eukprot:g960.t1